MTIVDMIMDHPDGVHMTDPHLGAIMTPTWTDALLLAETTMVMVVVTHIEVGVLEGLPQGTGKINGLCITLPGWRKVCGSNVSWTPQIDPST